MSTLLNISDKIKLETALSGDQDYNALLSYAQTQGYAIPSVSQRTLQETLIRDLKTAGVWDKLDVFYVFATDGDSDYATLNWKDPNNHQVSKVNSPVFTADSGFAGDGLSSYLDTNYNPSTNGVKYTLDNASISIWSNNYVFNEFITGASGTFNCIRMAGSSQNQRINMPSDATLTPVVNFSDSSKKLRQLNRTSSTNVTAIIDTTSTIHTGNSTDINSANQIILRAASFYSSTEVAFFGMGASLVSENVDFYNALNTYKLAL